MRANINAVPVIIAGDCQEFLVWAGIMGKNVSHYVPTQRTDAPVKLAGSTLGWRRCCCGFAARGFARFGEESLDRARSVPRLNFIPGRMSSLATVAMAMAAGRSPPTPAKSISSCGLRQGRCSEQPLTILPWRWNMPLLLSEHLYCLQGRPEIPSQARHSLRSVYRAPLCMPRREDAAPFRRSLPTPQHHQFRSYAPLTV